MGQPKKLELDLNDLPVDVFELSAKGLTVESLTVRAQDEDTEACVCPCSCACSGCNSSVCFEES